MEKSEILIAALQQRLVTEMSDYRESEHLGIETFRARQFVDLDAEMVEPLELHDAFSCARCRHSGSLRIDGQRAIGVFSQDPRAEHR
jgi:hypothetical protein